MHPIVGDEMRALRRLQPSAFSVGRRFVLASQRGAPFGAFVLFIHWRGGAERRSESGPSFGRQRRFRFLWIAGGDCRAGGRLQQHRLATAWRWVAAVLALSHLRGLGRAMPARRAGAKHGGQPTDGSTLAPTRRGDKGESAVVIRARVSTRSASANKRTADKAALGGTLR